MKPLNRQLIRTILELELKQYKIKDYQKPFQKKFYYK
jgi:hypothetical protein